MKVSVYYGGQVDQTIKDTPKQSLGRRPNKGIRAAWRLARRSEAVKRQAAYANEFPAGIADSARPGRKLREGLL